MSEALIDPDCRDRFKHRSCAGAPCECPCHSLPAVPEDLITEHTR